MLSMVRRILGLQRTAPTPLAVDRIDGFDEAVRYREEMKAEAARRQQIERSLIQPPPEFTVAGVCYVCNRQRQFCVDYRHAAQSDSGPVPNWRERLVCPGCGLNNRIRASVHLFDQECRPGPNDEIYLTEQTTALYRLMRRRPARITGSEYLGGAVPFGSTNTQGIRNESLTRLSFPDGQFRFILCFDVLEHIPDYRQALIECRRCLCDGGALLFSVPARWDSREHLVRAEVVTDGSVRHLLPPEYHGDPLSREGCLCFYHFGWKLLDEVRDVGFREACCLCYWSREYGYLGGFQRLFLARK